MSIYVYIQFAAVVTYVYFLGLLTAQRIADPVNRALRHFVITAFCWAFVEFLLLLPLSIGNEMWLKRVGFLFFSPLAFMFLRFLYIMRDRPKDWIYYALAAVAFVSAMLGLFTDYVIVSYHRYAWGVISVNGPLHGYLTAACGIAGLVSVGLGIDAFQKTSNKEMKRSLGWMVTGVVLSLFVGMLTDLVLPDILGIKGAPRFGFASMVLLLIFLHQAIIRHKFLVVDVEKVAEEIFESLPDGVLLVDRSDRVRRMNQVGRELFQSDRLDIGELDIKDLLRGFDPATQITEKEFTIEREETKHYVMVSSSPNLRGGIVVGQLVILRDITAQKAADELLAFRNQRLAEEVERQRIEMVQARKAERVGVAAGVIAHDFNNLLGGIIAYSSLAKDELPSGSVLREDFEEILKAGNKARNIVSRILAFSRRGKERWERVDLGRELHETVQLLDSSLPANIELVVEVDDDVGHLFAAPSRLRQIVMNIATNAYQSMKEKGGRLTISLKKKILADSFLLTHGLTQKGPYAEMSFTDTGEGLSQEQIELIFQPFFTTRDDDGGTGLGLATALRVASEIGGVIVCENEASGGSTFRVYLPLLASSLPSIVGESTGCTVLVVDDDETVGILCKRLLEPLGYEVETHTSPASAISKFETDPSAYDLVVSDQYMPEMVGTELFVRLKKIRPDLPGILISANSPATFKSAATEAGVSEILQKPFNQERLTSAVESVRNTGA